MSKFSTETSRWLAVQARDPSADGKFVYCVKTTGIYCRPICKARLARRSNVTFQSDSNAAEADGFRPCMRCKPQLERYDPQSEVISKACSTIRASAAQGREPSLKDLAAGAGLTQSHFHRIFKRLMGVTPKTHAKALLGKNRASVDIASSHHGSLTPSPGYSASASNGPLTPNAAPSPRVLVQRQDSSSLENIEPTSMMKANPDCLQLQIEFTIQPWRSGYVLIAVADNEVRAIDVGDDYEDLVARLQRRFLSADLLFSEWARMTKPPCTPSQLLFASVMEALENPTGKMLHLPDNVFVGS